MNKQYKTLVDYINNLSLHNIKVTNDSSAWVEYPEFNFVYNKLWVAQSQEIESAPLGVYPNKYPIIFKPIINLLGMSRGFKKINNEKEYIENFKDGLFWEEYLEGEHNCIDLIIVKGDIKFYSCLKSYQNGSGTFKYHESLPDFKLPEHLIFWIKSYLSEYTGALNLETINGLIIECHLRLNGDFQLYDENFVKSLDNFYKNKTWEIKNFFLKKIYLVPIFIKKEDTKHEIYKFINNSFKDLKKKLTYNSILIDNIESLCQSEHFSRVFMVETNCINSLNKLLNFQNNLI